MKKVISIICVCAILMSAIGCATFSSASYSIAGCGTPYDVGTPSDVTTPSDVITPGDAESDSDVSCDECSLVDRAISILVEVFAFVVELLNYISTVLSKCIVI